MLAGTPRACAVKLPLLPLRSWPRLARPCRLPAKEPEELYAKKSERRKLCAVKGNKRKKRQTLITTKEIDDRAWCCNFCCILFTVKRYARVCLVFYVASFVYLCFGQSFPPVHNGVCQRIQALLLLLESGGHLVHLLHARLCAVLVVVGRFQRDQGHSVVCVFIPRQGNCTYKG